MTSLLSGPMSKMTLTLTTWHEPWSKKAQWMGFAAAMLSVVAWQIWRHKKHPDSDIVKSGRVFFKDPNWFNFKTLVAAVASDPWQNLVILFMVALLPTPFLPKTAHGRVQFLLAKLGMLSLFTLIVVGTPTYVISKDDGFRTHLPGFIFGGFLVVVVVVSKLLHHFSVKAKG